MGDICAVILAGGLATRMGGGDKSLLNLGGSTLLDHVVMRLKPQCSLLALNANGDPARFARFRLPVIPDPLHGHPGPLAGILAGLDWAAAEGFSSIVTVAADTPFLPRDLVARLRYAAAVESRPIALAATAEETGKPAIHPTFGLWPVALRHDLREALSSGTRRVRQWAQQHGTAIAVFSSKPFDPFLNINTPDDLATAQALLEKAC